MRPYHFIALAAAGLALACGEHTAQRITEVSQRLDSSSVSTLAVTVLRLTADSTLKPVAGAQVRFIRVGEVPPDSVPDSLPPPPDSTPPSDSLTGLGSLTYQLSDSIPGDSTPPPPPPPPPPSSCGRDGRTLARGLTNRQGVATAIGLPSGKYDILVAPPAGSRLQGGVFCGVHLLPGQSSQVRVVLVP